MVREYGELLDRLFCAMLNCCCADSERRFYVSCQRYFELLDMDKNIRISYIREYDYSLFDIHFVRIIEDKLDKILFILLTIF